MSLNGNLEDLPLLDIIQIVSFSKKTGYLTISTPDGDGAIVFDDGYVIAAFTWDSLPVDPRAATLPADKRSMLLRNRIELALEQMIRLREGPFRFSLTETAPKRVGDRELGPETLDPGLNAQELLLDLARGMDEDRRDSSAALEASFAAPSEEAFVALPTAPSEVVAAEPTDEEGEISPEEAANRAVAAFAKGVAPAEPERALRASTMPAVLFPDRTAPPGLAPSPPPELRTVLLVDDEDDVREILAERFTAAGYEVVDAEDPDSAVKQAGRLGKEGVPFVLVTDLGMPTSGGSSFQGGFEVVKRLWKMKIEPPVLMMTESLSAALRARARQMSISSFVFKPGLSKLDRPQFEADLRAFAAKIVDDILPGLTKPGGGARRAKSKGVASEAGARPAPMPTVEELSRQFDLLHRRLEELRRPQDATQISVLVMTVAREFFERGILFLVKNEEARGLGGFGSAPREESLNLLVREVMIPLSEPSVFLDVVSRRKPFSGPLPDGKWKNYLFGKIGRFKSETVSLLPLLTHRETIAVLFGDNPETGREFGRLDGLEVFINQAGIALENAFLQRKVQALQNP